MNGVERRAALLRNRGINLVLDVGANAGQFALSLRKDAAFKGRIVSFEPLREAYQLLEKAAAQDSNWTCHNCGLSDASESAIINVSANSYSSSLLPVSPHSLSVEPSISYVRKEPVKLCRLDSMFKDICRDGDVVYLKIDTQGYEDRVLAGALGSLERIEAIELEVSFYQVYQGQALAGDLIKFLDYVGYRVISIEPAWEDHATSEVLQADLIFGRKIGDRKRRLISD